MGHLIVPNCPFYGANSSHLMVTLNLSKIKDILRRIAINLLVLLQKPHWRNIFHFLLNKKKQHFVTRLLIN